MFAFIGNVFAAENSEFIANEELERNFQSSESSSLNKQQTPLSKYQKENMQKFDSLLKSNGLIVEDTNSKNENSASQKIIKRITETMKWNLTESVSSVFSSGKNSAPSVSLSIPTFEGDLLKVKSFQTKNSEININIDLHEKGNEIALEKSTYKIPLNRVNAALEQVMEVEDFKYQALKKAEILYNKKKRILKKHPNKVLKVHLEIAKRIDREFNLNTEAQLLEQVRIQTNYQKNTSNKFLDKIIEYRNFNIISEAEFQDLMNGEKGTNKAGMDLKLNINIFDAIKLEASKNSSAKYQELADSIVESQERILDVVERKILLNYKLEPKLINSLRFGLAVSGSMALAAAIVTTNIYLVPPIVAAFGINHFLTKYSDSLENNKKRTITNTVISLSHAVRTYFKDIHPEKQKELLRELESPMKKAINRRVMCKGIAAG